MKKYTVTITSTETATVEIIANSKDEAIEKAADMDYGELDWCCGESDYEIEDEETIEYTEEEAMKDIMKTIDRHGFEIVQQEDGRSALTYGVIDRVVSLPLDDASTAKALAHSVHKASSDFDVAKEALKHIHSIEKVSSTYELTRIPDRYRALGDRLFQLESAVENYLDD